MKMLVFCPKIRLIEKYQPNINSKYQQISLKSYDNSKSQMFRHRNSKTGDGNSNFLSIILVICSMVVLGRTFNESICLSFRFNQMYFIVNNQFTYQNIIQNDSAVTYNYCHQIQYYCSFTNQVINASLILKNAVKNKCYPYTQYQIEMIDPNNGSAGVKIIYALNVSSNDPEIAEKIVKSYPCKWQNGVQKYCPEVDYSIIWRYFNQNQLVYTIVTEVVGVILMLLGVYIYRVTIILLGSATVFVALVAAQAYIAFTPGVSSSFLSNVLIMTGVCSFVAGYVFGYFPKVGLFCMGLWIGSIISLTLNNVAFYLINTNPPNLVLYIVLPVLGVGFGILTIFIKKSFIIFATSLIGAYMCLRALSWHLGAFPNEFIFSRSYQLKLVGIIQWQFYLYVVALLILTASASALQYWLFNKKIATSEGKNIEEHFQQMQHKVEQQRGKVMQFKNVFKKGGNQPRKLRRNTNSSVNSKQVDQSEQDDQQNENEAGQDQNSESSEKHIAKQNQRQQPNKKKSNRNSNSDQQEEKPNKKRRNKNEDSDQQEKPNKKRLNRKDNSDQQEKPNKKRQNRKENSDQQDSSTLNHNELMKRLIVKKK